MKRFKTSEQLYVTCVACKGVGTEKMKSLWIEGFDGVWRLAGHLCQRVTCWIEFSREFHEAKRKQHGPKQ